MDFGSGSSFASSKSIANLTMEAGGPGSGRKPSLISRHETENALRTHGFKLQHTASNGSTWSKNMSKPWHSATNARDHMHEVSVSGDGSFSYSTVAGQPKPIIGKGADDVNSKIGPHVKEKVSTIRKLTPEESADIKKAFPGHSMANVQARAFNVKQRKKLAKKGAAMKDGSYPIVTAQDLHNAIQSIGRAKDPDATKAHIKKRAKALGLTKALPADWGKKIEAKTTDVTDAKPTKKKKLLNKIKPSKIIKKQGKPVIGATGDKNYVPNSDSKKVDALHKKLTDKGYKLQTSDKYKKMSVHKYTHSNGNKAKIIETGAGPFIVAPDKKAIAAARSLAAAMVKVAETAPKLPVDYTLPKNSLGRPGTTYDPFDLEVDDVSLSAAGFGDDDQRKAFFAKTVGGHNDASAIHEDMGDYHTAQAAKLSTSKSVLAPKLAAAHTQAATAHYAASELHDDASSDLTKSNTATAQKASQNAFKASSKVDAMPKPKNF